MADSTISVVMAAVFLYCSSFLVGLLLNNIVDKWLPEPVRQYGFDYLKTMVICAYPFGHAILWKCFGGTGFLCGMVPVMLLTIFVLPRGEGTPIATWIKYFSGVLPLRQCLLKTAIHMSAGLAAYQLGILLLQSRLNWHCILKLREHEDRTCKSTLNVSVLKGLIIESLGVMYDLWFSSKTFSENKFVDAFVKVGNTGIVVITGEYDFHVCVKK